MKTAPGADAIEVFELDAQAPLSATELVQKAVAEVDRALMRGASIVGALWRAPDAPYIIRGMEPKQLALTLFPTDGKTAGAAAKDIEATIKQHRPCVMCAFSYNTADLVTHALMVTAAVVGNRFLIIWYNSPLNGELSTPPEHINAFWAQLPSAPMRDPRGYPLN